MKIDVNVGNEHLLEHFPNFEYFNCTEPERLNFFKTNNLVGDQQRAFLIYHILKEVQRTGEVGLNLGCGQVIDPLTIGIDKYCTDDHPLYHGKYWPHLTANCEKLPFNDNTVAFIVGSHIFEHMDNPLETFREWIRVLKPNGAMILVMPDATYESPVQPWDFDHKMFYTPAIFNERILVPCKDLIKTEQIDRLRNRFSFDYIGRKI